jgi:hypothetical protein
VRTQPPAVARNTDGRLGNLGHGVFVGEAVVRLLRIAQEFLNLLVRKAHQVEVEAVLFERLQLHPQHGLVPSCVECQTVIREHERAPLYFAEAVKNDDRHFGHAQFAGCQQAGVTRDDDPIAAGENRRGPTEFDNRCGDLRHLLRRVRARVASVGQQLVDRPLHYLEVGY